MDKPAQGAALTQFRTFSGLNRRRIYKVETCQHLQCSIPWQTHQKDKVMTPCPRGGVGPLCTFIHVHTCETRTYKSLRFGAMVTLPTTYHTAAVICVVKTPLTCRGAPCQFRWTADCSSCDSDMVMRRSMSSITGDPGSRNSLSVICSGTCPGIERRKHDTHIVDHHRLEVSRLHHRHEK